MMHTNMRKRREKREAREEKRRKKEERDKKKREEKDRSNRRNRHLPNNVVKPMDSAFYENEMDSFGNIPNLDNMIMDEYGNIFESKPGVSYYEDEFGNIYEQEVQVRISDEKP